PGAAQKTARRLKFSCEIVANRRGSEYNKSYENLRRTSHGTQERTRPFTSDGSTGSERKSGNHLLLGNQQKRSDGFQYRQDRTILQRYVRLPARACRLTSHTPTSPF